LLIGNFDKQTNFLALNPVFSSAIERHLSEKKTSCAGLTPIRYYLQSFRIIKMFKFSGYEVPDKPKEAEKPKTPRTASLLSVCQVRSHLYIAGIFHN
jgi:hypothetical protein